MQKLSSILALLVVSVGLAQAQDQPQTSAQSAPSLEEIVARVEQAQEDNRSRFRPYTVTRDYRLFQKSEAAPAKSEVRADVSFLPPDQKKFQIQRSTGGFGEGVVRRVLEGEAELAKSAKKTQIGSANYDFKLVREETGSNGGRAYVLELIPKRSDKSLIRGLAWVCAETFRIQKVEGELAKSPSFWVKEVKVRLSFGDVGGMWLQTGTHSVANVRLKGKYVLTSRDVDFRVAEQVATKRSGPRRAATRLATVVR